MFAKSRSIVGLDIGASSVKAIELTTVGRSVEVTGFGQIEVAADDHAARAAAISELMKEGGFRTRRVVTSLSGKTVIVRYLTMPRMTDAELKNAIAFEAGKYVPFPVEECVIDCQRIESAQEKAGDGNMTVLFVAVRRAQLDEHLDLITQAGVTPAILDVDVFALGNAWDLLGPHAPGEDGRERSIAFVDVGASKTCLSITIGDTALFTREIYVGGQDFTEAIAHRLNIEPRDAEDLKRDPGDNAEQVREAVLPRVDDLGTEIQASFDYFENQFERQIDEIRLSGGGSRMDCVRDAFARIFEKPTSIFNPFESMTINPAVDADLLFGNASRLVVATGLAARLRKV